MCNRSTSANNNNLINWSGLTKNISPFNQEAASVEFTDWWGVPGFNICGVIIKVVVTHGSLVLLPQ